MPDELFEQLSRFQQLAGEIDWKMVAGGAFATVIGSWILGIPRYLCRLMHFFSPDKQGGRSGRADSWRKEPVTKRQVRRLVKLGVPRHVAEQMRKGEASDTIAALSRE